MISGGFFMSPSWAWMISFSLATMSAGTSVEAIQRGLAAAICMAELLDQVLELAVAGDEVGLAVELDEHADAAVHVDVGADEAFLGGPAGLGLGPGVALLAQDLDGLVHVAVALGQGALALHHADAGPLAQLFDLIRRDLHDILFPFRSALFGGLALGRLLGGGFGLPRPPSPRGAPC